MHVKYIGPCIKTDSFTGVGMRWEPGQVRSVTPELGERLLAHPDTWEKVEAPDDAAPIGILGKETATEEPLPVVDYHAFDKKGLVEYAETKHGVKLDKNKSLNNLRHEVIDLDSQRQPDQDSA